MARADGKLSTPTNNCSRNRIRRQDYKSVEGNLSARLAAHRGDVCHFGTVTKWDMLRELKKFAGEDVEKAKYYPEDSKYLLEFEPNGSAPRDVCVLMELT